MSGTNEYVLSWRNTAAAENNDGLAVQKFANAHTAQVAPHAGTSDLKRKRSKRRKAKRDKQRNVNEADSAPSSSLAVLLAQVIKE